MQYWLDQPGWTEQRSLHKDLTTTLLRQQGNIIQIKKNYRNDFENNPNYVNLDCYWEMANTQERKFIQKKVEVAVKLIIMLWTILMRYSS